MTSDSLADLPATDLVAGFRAGRFTPVDVLEATVERIDQVNPVLNAFVGLDLDSARAAAEASSARWADGRPSGAVDGVPVTIKDTMALRGWPTRKGSAQTDPNKLASGGLPGTSAPAGVGGRDPRQDDRAGVRLEGLQRLATDRAHPQPVGNGPHHRRFVRRRCRSGGDGHGRPPHRQRRRGVGAHSGRVHAASSGIKGTFGVVPIYPPSTGGLLSHVGPLTRTVGDAALMLEVIGRPDGRELLPHPR